MKIVILETIEMSEAQRRKLGQLGLVECYDSSAEEEVPSRIRGADVVVVDWIDPSSFLLSMKAKSLLALMSTGYGWVQHREQARAKGVMISNVPGYATEAVAEHLLGLILCLARHIAVGDRAIRSDDRRKGHLRGIELRDRILGIIGLGQIGQRLAELGKCLGMHPIAYTRTPKSIPGVEAVTLDALLSQSDVLVVCCPLNEQTAGLLNGENLRRLKPGAILVSATWGIVVIDDLVPLLAQKHLGGAGFDVAIEAAQLEVPTSLLALDNIILTPHVAFNTHESACRRTEVCLRNIAAFAEGKPQNIIN